MTIKLLERKSMALNYTVNQHYVPQFVLRNFVDDKGKLGVADVAGKSFRFWNAQPDKIFFKKDLYESQNLDGTYFERNAVESYLSKLEGQISSCFATFQSTVEQKECISGEDRMSIALFLAMQAVRNPWISDAINSILLPDVDGDERRKAFSNSRMLFNLLPPDMLYRYLDCNNISLSEKEKAQMPPNTAILGLLNDYVFNSFMFIIVAEKGASFYLSDNTPLNCRYEDCRLLIPISPSLAVGCCPAKAAKQSNKNGIVRLPKSKIDLVNSNIIKNAKRFIVFAHYDLERAKQDVLRCRIRTLNY